MTLTLREAQIVLAAGEVRARSIGVNVSISVVDARGDLIITERMDGARWFSPGVALGKAAVSAAYGLPSGEMASSAGMPVPQSLTLMTQGRMIFGQGAVPIKRGHVLEGAIGVSGATSQEDEDIAIAGSFALRT